MGYFNNFHWGRFTGGRSGMYQPRFQPTNCGGWSMNVKQQLEMG